MSEDEKRATVLEEIRSDPTAPVSILTRRTGVQRHIVASVRGQAVKDGIAEAAARPDQKRKRKTEPRVPASRDDDLAMVRLQPGVTAKQFARLRGISFSTAERRLKRLARDGLVERRQEGRGNSPTIYEAVSSSEVAA